MSWIDPYTSQIQGFEGYVPKAAWDYKQYTNGYGTRAQYPGETVDRDTASKRFSEEIKKASDSVDAFAPNAPPGVKAALTSLTFNAGPKWQEQGLGQSVKSGDYGTAKKIFLGYNHAGGQVNDGLTSRRNTEAGWFDKPVDGAYSHGSMNGGFGMSPTGDAGIAGSIDTAEAGHDVPTSQFKDLQPPAPQTTAVVSAAPASGSGPVGAFSPLKTIGQGVSAAASAFGGGSDNRELQKQAEEQDAAAQRANANAINEDQQRGAQALQTLLSRIKSRQPQAAFG